MKGMIFAAGLGTRLSPLTDTLPKALVPVGGEPLLGHVLRKFRKAGLRDVVINVHPFPEQMEAWLAENRLPGMRIRLSYEREAPLETGGGIRHAAPLLAGCGKVLIHNVDILSNLDLRRFCADADPDALATLVVSARETSRYLLFDDGMRLVGWTDLRTGEVRSPFPALDPAACRRYAFSGIHLLDERILALMEPWPERFSIIDFYLSAAADHVIRGYVPEDLRLLDVGKPAALADAENFLVSL